MKPSEFKISISSKVMIKKGLKITEIATLPKSELFLNHQKYRSQFLIAEIVDLKEGCVQIVRLYLSYFPSNKPSKRLTIGSGPAGPSLSLVPKMVRNYSIFFEFFKGFRAV